APAEPPTQISGPEAANARSVEEVGTATLAQVCPESKERCSVPSAESVQRGVGTAGALNATACFAIVCAVPPAMFAAPVLRTGCLAFPAKTASFAGAASAISLSELAFALARADSAGTSACSAAA